LQSWKILGVFDKGFWDAFIFFNSNKKWLMWYNVQKSFKFFVRKSENVMFCSSFFLIVIKSGWCVIKGEKSYNILKLTFLDKNG
jgi:hypothetical protein